jgi:hypothetical protein
MVAILQDTNGAPPCLTGLRSHDGLITSHIQDHDACQLQRGVILLFPKRAKGTLLVVVTSYSHLPNFGCKHKHKSDGEYNGLRRRP